MQLGCNFIYLFIFTSLWLSGMRERMYWLKLSVRSLIENSGQVSSNFMKRLWGYRDLKRNVCTSGKKVLRFYSATFKIYGGRFKPLMCTCDLSIEWKMYFCIQHLSHHVCISSVTNVYITVNTKALMLSKIKASIPFMGNQ